MDKIELVIPKLGESVEEVTLTKWLHKEGDQVNSGDILAEISTDKVDSDMPSPYSGKIINLFFKEGDTIKVGEIFAILDITEENPTFVYNQTNTSEDKKNEHLSKKENVQHFDKNIFLSPLVKKIFKEEKLTSGEIEQIAGTGLQGRITKNDVLNFINQRHSQAPLKKAEDIDSSKKVLNSISADAEIIEIDKMRHIMLKHMKKSKHISAHVTAFVEVDVSNMLRWRNEHKDSFLKTHKQKLTITPLIVSACVRAIKDFPMINVSVDETETKIIAHKSINIGIATALSDGNLIVPVIKNTEKLNLEGLTKNINHLVNKARTNKLLPDDVVGGTFTISNVGTFGNLMGTPIINQPEVAILAIGFIKKKPAVLETPEGDVIAIRQFMFLSLSFDHRVVNGSLGGAFLSRIAEYIENWNMSKDI